MDRDMKYHIYDMEHNPLCYDDMVIDFNSKEQAEEIFKKFIENKEEAIIVEDILYYDGGYIDYEMINWEEIKYEG